MEQKKIAFIGAGNMSCSIINGLVAKHYPSTLIKAANPSQGKLDKLQSDLGILTTNDNDEAIAWADIVVLAVKPHLMENVCRLVKCDNITNKLFITIAAGITSSRYNDYFGQEIRLVRCMPNTPSLLGLGMTGIYASNTLAIEDRDISSEILKSVGEVMWVEDEAHIDTVTACSGSSPAYFFLFMEYMQQSAIKMGLSAEEARQLIQQSALGAAQMVRHNNHLELSELRKQVTSKGGTTHAAIETFKAHNLDKSVDEAMKNAVARAQQMAQQF